jgi:RNA polymerase sigma-70 factor (ECF subfamily)
MDGEDLAQETFIHAYEKLKSFRADARFSSWLYRIAINLCLNWQKQNRRRAEVHAEYREDREQPGGESDWRTALVEDALRKLAPKQRATVVLTVYEGLTHAEAAQALGCSETTISWRLFAARRKLKALIGKCVDVQDLERKESRND